MSLWIFLWVSLGIFPVEISLSNLPKDFFLRSFPLDFSSEIFPKDFFQKLSCRYKTHSMSTRFYTKIAPRYVELSPRSLKSCWKMWYAENPPVMTQNPPYRVLDRKGCPPKWRGRWRRGRRTVTPPGKKHRHRHRQKRRQEVKIKKMAKEKPHRWGPIKWRDKNTQQKQDFGTNK